MATSRAGRRRWIAVVALSAIVAALFAGLNSGLGPFPPNDEEAGLQVSTAAAHVLVDSPSSSPSIASRRALQQDVETAVKHAELLGRVMVTPPVLDRIAQRCEIERGELSGLGRTTANVPLALTEPDSERRASAIQASKARYALEVQGRPSAAVIDLYAQAPSPAGAECLADAAVTGLRDYQRDLGRRQGVDQASLARLRPLGETRAAVVNSRAPLVIAVLTFLVVFAISSLALAGLIELRKRRLAGRAGRPSASDGGLARFGIPRSPLARAEPEANGSGANGSGAGSGADCWPHTKRLLPWTLAFFIALVWLVPFNSLDLNASFPIDLTLDRLVLPVVAVSWLMAFVAGGKLAPSRRLTWIHLALGTFLLIAFLSVVLDARYLNQTLELELSMKKLPLILSYVAIFAITASAVRRGEIRAFLNFTLALAVICALGTIFEYRFEQNLFWELSDKLLPGIFTLTGQLDGDAVDGIGRRLVRGPGETPVEVVAMLTLALPIALIGLLDTRRWLARLLYGLAACALIAAVLATHRKSAIVAPAAVVLTLAFFRRRDLLKLVPLGLVVLFIVVAVSPGALSSILGQFTRSDRATVPTVSDRASDYDAIRPDVWSNLLLGRGWGSYNHETYRILDSEILQRTVETGVVGLIAFLMIGLTVIGCTRKAIASRDPFAAPVALLGASIAVGFIVLALLFDVLSFPHAPYIFLYLTGLVAVAIRREPSGDPERAQPPRLTLYRTAPPGMRPKDPIAPLR